MQPLNPNIPTARNLMPYMMSPDRMYTAEGFVPTPDHEGVESSPVTMVGCGGNSINIPPPTSATRPTTKTGLGVKGVIADKEKFEKEKLEKENALLKQKNHELQKSLTEQNQELKTLQAEANRVNHRDRAKESQEITKLNHRIASLEKTVAEKNQEIEAAVNIQRQEKETFRTIVHKWKHSLDMSEKKFAEAAEANMKQQTQLQRELTEQRQMHEDTLAKLHSEMNEHKRQRDEYKLDVEKFQAEVRTLKHDLDSSRLTSITTQTQHDLAMKEIASLQSKITAVEQESTRLRCAVEEKEKLGEMQKQHTQVVEKELIECQSRLHQAELKKQSLQHELSLAVDDRTRFTAQVSSLQLKESSLSSACQRRQQELNETQEKLKRDWQAHNELVAEKNAEIDALRMKLLTAKSEGDNASAKLMLKIKELSDLQNAFDRRGDELDGVRNVLNETVNKLESRTNEFNELQIVALAEKSDMEGLQDKLSADVSRLQSELDELKDEKTRLTTKVEHLQSMIDLKSQENLRMKLELQNMYDTNENQLGEIKSLRSSNETLMTTILQEKHNVESLDEQLKDEKLAHSMTKTTMETTIANLERTLNNVKASEHELIDKISSQATSADNLNSEVLQLKVQLSQVITERRCELKAKEDEILELREKLAQLTTTVNTLQDEHSDELKKAGSLNKNVEFLQQNLESLRLRYEEEKLHAAAAQDTLASLRLEKDQTVRDLEEALYAKEQEYEVVLRSKEGDIAKLNEALTLSSSSIAACRAELDDARAANAALEVTITNLNSDIERMMVVRTTEAQSTSSELSVMQFHLNRSKMDLQEQQHNNSILTTKVSSLEAQLANAKLELQDETNRLNALQEQLNTVTADFKASMSTKEHSVEEMTRVHRTEMEKLYKQLRDKMQEGEQERVNLQTIQNQNYSLSTKLDELEEMMCSREAEFCHEKAKLKSKVESLSSSLEEMTSKFHACRQDLAQTSASLEQVNSQLHQAQKHVARLSDEKKHLEDMVEETKTQVFAGEAAQKITVERVNSLKASVTQLQTQIQTERDTISQLRNKTSELTMERDHAVRDLKSLKLSLETEYVTREKYNTLKQTHKDNTETAEKIRANYKTEYENHAKTKVAFEKIVSELREKEAKTYNELTQLTRKVKDVGADKAFRESASQYIQDLHAKLLETETEVRSCYALIQTLTGSKGQKVNFASKRSKDVVANEENPAKERKFE
eukprot:PhF_6_TR26309/c1_g1_i1/m.37774